MERVERATSPMMTELSVAWQQTAPPRGLSIVDRLLRDRDGLLAAIEREEDLAGLSRAMALTVLIAGGAFGGALGAYRGGPQILLAAIKLPLACLLTAAICTPLLTAMRQVFLKEGAVRRDAALVLSCLALGVLATSALTPLVLLAVFADVSYHRIILVAVAAGTIGGWAGLALFVRSLKNLELEARRFLTVTVLAAFTLVGTQASWTLRPFVTRPRSGIVVLRPIQGSFIDSAVRSAESAAGLPAPALLGDQP